MSRVSVTPGLRSFMDNGPLLLDVAAEYILLRYLTWYAPRDFRTLPWGNLMLTPAYARRKAGIVAQRDKHKQAKAIAGQKNRTPIADLYLTGKLRQELMVEAPKSVTVSKGVAKTFLRQSVVPYAAAHNYGTGRMPVRRFIRIADHSKALARDCVRVIISLIKAGAK